MCFAGYLPSNEAARGLLPMECCSQKELLAVTFVFIFTVQFYLPGKINGPLHRPTNLRAMKSPVEVWQFSISSSRKEKILLMCLWIGHASLMQGRLL